MISGVHFHGQVRPVLAAERPLGDVGITCVEVLLGFREPLDVLGRDQIHDRLADDLLASVAEHAAAGAVHVGVATREIRHEDPVGGMLDEVTTPRSTQLERLVRAVEGRGGDGEQEQTRHGHHDGERR